MSPWDGEGHGSREPFEAEDRRQLGLFSLGKRNYLMVHAYTMTRNRKRYVTLQRAFVPQKDENGQPLAENAVKHLRFEKGKSVTLALEAVPRLMEALRIAAEDLPSGVKFRDREAPF